MREKILFIGGSLNQTRMMYKISQQLAYTYDCYFTPYYADGFVNKLAQWGLLEMTVLGSRHQNDTLSFIKDHDLPLDWRGESNDYDLVVTGSDLIVQKNIRGKRVVLLQDGIPDPKSFLFYLVKWLRLPRYLANSSAIGLSNKYDIFCVSTHGYRNYFIQNGVDPEKIVVTGIPNFDNTQHSSFEHFLHRGLIPVGTLPFQEILRHDNKYPDLNTYYHLADGRNLVFNLHPAIGLNLEKTILAKQAIKNFFPKALVFSNSHLDLFEKIKLIFSQKSLCLFTAVAMRGNLHILINSKVIHHSNSFQTNERSIKNIANICIRFLRAPTQELKANRNAFRTRLIWENNRLHK